MFFALMAVGLLATLGGMVLVVTGPEGVGLGLLVGSLVIQIYAYIQGRREGRFR